MPSRATLARILAAAFAFGLLAALAKGQNTDGVQTMSQVRGDLGSLSTPRLPLTARMVWGWGLGADSGAVALSVYALEFAIGLAVVLLVMRRRVARAT